MKKRIDIWSLIIIVVTFILFIVALFVKGLTQDMLLEAGVLLVSIKIIMMAHKNNVDTAEIKKELSEIKEMIRVTCE